MLAVPHVITLIVLVALASGGVAAQADIGTAHPLVITAVDPGARWVVLCQAREDTDDDGVIEVQTGYHGETYGDTLKPFVVWGAGAGEPIDGYVAHSRNGQRLALAVDGVVKVFDADTREVLLELPRIQTLRRLITSTTDPALTFDGEGERLLVVAPPPGHGPAEEPPLRAVLHELDTGESWPVDVGPGLLVRAWLDGGGVWVMADVVAEDTDGNGSLEPPLVHSSLAPAGCRGPVMSFSSGRLKGDTPVRRYVLAGGGAVLEAEPEWWLDDHALARRADGSLIVFDPTTGSARPVLDGRTDLAVVGGTPGRGLVAVAGGDDDGRSFWTGPAEDEPLPEDVLLRVVGRGEQRLDRALGLWRIMIRVGDDWSDGVLDTERGVWRVTSGELMARHGDVDLTHRKGPGLFTRAGDDEPERLGAHVMRWQSQQRGARVWFGGDDFLVDLEQRRYVDTPDTAVALDTAGRLLLSATPSTFDDLATGPLRWVDPFDD